MIIAFISVLLIILFLINKWYRFQFTSLFGLLSQFIFIALGIIIFQGYNTKPYFFDSGNYLATVLEAPQEKQNSYKSVIKVNFAEQDGTVRRTNEKVLVYFAKNEPAKILKAGDRIIAGNSPNFIKNFGNPYEFDYKNYLARKRIYRQVYLSAQSWKPAGSSSKNLLTIAEQFREKLLNIYEKQKLGNNETEILSALTLGYKRGLDPEIKRVFSSAGAMHVLAVSGLHVGIIYMVFAFLFGFLRKRKTGRYIFIISSILLLWSYACITGLSPSVLRASTMFTIVIIGTNINRRANIYNSLAASAMFLLLINPNNLFEVGFQLSYAAVFGIVFLQPKLAVLWPVENKILKFFWSLLTVSVAAQIATFPLTSYYFNQFPTYFWITNLIVIPAVTLLIPLGIAILCFANVPVVSTILAFLVKYLIKGVYFILKSIELLPYSVQEVSIHPIELIFLLAFLFSIFYFFAGLRPNLLKWSLLFLLLLSVSTLAINYRNSKNKTIIIYNADNPTIHLISGKKNYLISDKKPEENLGRMIQAVKCNKRLSQPVFIQKNKYYEDKLLYLNDEVIAFEGKIICLGESPQKVKDIIPDYQINQGKQELNKLSLVGTRLIYCKDYLLSAAKKEQVHILKTDGAFCESWQ